jgi:hypothetical protein
VRDPRLDRVQYPRRRQRRVSRRDRADHPPGLRRCRPLGLRREAPRSPSSTTVARCPPVHPAIIPATHPLASVRDANTRSSSRARRSAS